MNAHSDRTPDAPRLAFDELLDQLVSRAREVSGTRDRLRGLLRANQLVVGDLAVDVVLQRIVQAARDLVGARYAALGVIGPEGGLIEFVHTGMDGSTAVAIGALPQGKGLLGALIDDPRPIRSDRIGDDPRSSGFPAGHPPMDSFLGVPIRIRDEVFGNLYLAESDHGRFSAEDEELLTALAANAAVAIDNARLYASAHARGEWLQAVAAITRELLEPTSRGAQDALRMIGERARDVAQADLVSVVLPTERDDELRVAVAVGEGAERVDGRAIPVVGSLSGDVFRSGRPLRLTHPDDAAGHASVAADVLDVGPVLVVPLTGSTKVHGVLSTVRVTGRPAFTGDEVEMAGSFANQAALAIELAEARARHEAAAIDDERDRIAVDLHQNVITALFATGLSLEGLVGQVGPGPIADQLLAGVRDLDAAIAQLRAAIFRLEELRPADGPV